MKKKNGKKCVCNDLHISVPMGIFSKINIHKNIDCRLKT